MSLLERINTPEDVKKLNNDELETLAVEIRQFLIENVMHSGGHLASNLGVVETTLALLKTFDFSKDKIVFDVGHQCYVYKLLTGRKDKFKALRHLGGISGFPRRSESQYDFFDVGHAGTSISAAVGMARARDLKGTNEHIIALVGDGALTNGMCFEALNDVGLRKTNVIIILNDNAMSIHKNVGGLSLHLSKLRFHKRYKSTKDSVQDFLNKFGSFGKGMSNAIRTVKDRIKYATIAAPLFEQIGITYMGIVDGNNTEAVSLALERAKSIEGPVLIHTYTKKGMGFTDAENNPSKFHGVSGDTIRLNPAQINYDGAFSSVITSVAKDNEKVVAVTAAMESGCGLSDFSQQYPERFFDVGIAEEHAVTMAAGFASSGYTPVVCLYSTFLQRTYDQIVHDVCLQNLHVVFAVGHAGLTGEDGETHQGLLDLSMLCHIPNMTVLAPSTYDELKVMITYAINECKGPVAVRYPKAGVSFRESVGEINPTKVEIIKEGSDILVLSCGRMAETAIEVSNLAKEKGISACVANVRCVKPFDKETIEKLALGKKIIVTLEDNITDGGMGQHIISNIELRCSVMNFGFSTCFVSHGKQEELFKLNGFEPQSIVEKIYQNYIG